MTMRADWLDLGTYPNLTNRVTEFGFQNVMMLSCHAPCCLAVHIVLQMHMGNVDSLLTLASEADGYPSNTHTIFVDTGSDLAELLDRIALRPASAYLKLTLPCRDTPDGQEDFFFLVEGVAATPAYDDDGRGIYAWKLDVSLHTAPLVLSLIFYGDEEEDDRFGIRIAFPPQAGEHVAAYLRFKHRARTCGMAVGRRSMYTATAVLEFVPVAYGSLRAQGGV